MKPHLPLFVLTALAVSFFQVSAAEYTLPALSSFKPTATTHDKSADKIIKGSSISFANNSIKFSCTPDPALAGTWFEFRLPEVWMESERLSYKTITGNGSLGMMNSVVTADRVEVEWASINESAVKGNILVKKDCGISWLGDSLVVGNVTTQAGGAVELPFDPGALCVNGTLTLGSGTRLYLDVDLGDSLTYNRSAPIFVAKKVVGDLSKVKLEWWIYEEEASGLWIASEIPTTQWKLKSVLQSNGLTAVYVVPSDNIQTVRGKNVTYGSGTISRCIVGGGAVVKNTTGTLKLSAANTYTGGTVIKGGTLVAGSDLALGTGTVTLNAGTLHMGSRALFNNINVNATTAVINGGTAYRGNLTLTKGTLSGQNINLYTGRTAMLRTGILKNNLVGAGKVVKDTTGTAYLYGTNTYKGGTTVKAGILSAKNVKALGTGAVTLTGGSLYLNSLAVANAINVNATSAIIKGSTKYKGKLTLTKGTLSGDKINLTSGKNAYLKTGTVKNALGGTGHVYKQGTGTVTLAGTNNWTGNTYVQGGTLVISGATSLRGTTRTYANSKLDVRRAVTMGNLYLGGGTLALKAGNMLTVTGTLTLANATKLALSGVTASSPVLIKYGKLSNTSKLAYAKFFGLTSAYKVTNAGGKLTISLTNAKQAAYAVESEKTFTASTEALGQATWGTARAARLFDHTVRDHAQAQSVALDKNRSVWFAGMSGFSHVDDASDTNICGGAVGMQFNGSMGGNAGIAIGQTYGHVSPAGATRVKQQTQHAALYVTKMLYASATDSVSLTGTASYGTTDSDHETLDWTQHSAVLGVRGTWEHKLDKATAVYGFAGLEYLATDSESGSGSIQALQGSIGAGISHTEGRLTLHADASFTPDMVRNTPSSTVNPGRLGFELGAGATYRLSDKWSLNAGYTYHNEKHADSHEAYIGARCTF